MSNKTEQRLLSSLIHEVSMHPYKDELLDLMVEQINDW